MKITRRQLRRIIKEELLREEQQVSPEAWAAQNSLQLEFDNEGQKIIYLDNEQAERLDMPPGVKWDSQPVSWSDGGGWVIYTGEYHEEAGAWSDERDYEAGFMS